MKYIPLDDVLNSLLQYDKHIDENGYQKIRRKIKSLISIDLSIIDEMIDEVKKSKDPQMLFARAGLEELKERLSLNK